MQNNLHGFSIIIFYYFCLAMIICAQKLPVIIQRDCKAHIASGFYCSDRIRYLIPIPLFHNNMTKLFFFGLFLLTSYQTCHYQKKEYPEYSF